MTRPFKLTDLYRKESDNILHVFVDAVPAPRLTRNQVKLVHIRDSALDAGRLQIKSRVQRYERYKQTLQFIAKDAGFSLGNRIAIEIYLAMPPTWSEAKKKEMYFKPHQQTPDTDNLLKAIKDALCKKDQHIWDEHCLKRWANKGYIVITNIDQ